MDGSMIANSKEQERQIPPLDVVRIVVEISSAIALELVVLYVFDAIFSSIRDRPKPCPSGAIGVGMVVLHIYFLLYVLVSIVSAASVYFVGSTDKQTGSFLATLVCSFMAGIFAIVLLFVNVKLLTGPVYAIITAVTATFGFNLTRRYKLE